MVHHTRLKPEPERIPAVVVDAEKRARICLAAVDAAVSHQDYLLAEFSAADIMMGYSLMLASSLGILDDQYPAANVYFDRLKAMQGFIAASQ